VDDLFIPYERRRGLPIVDLTSQYFDNICLILLDYFILESLKCRRYIRYVDDLLLFGDSKSRLFSWFREMCKYLQKFCLSLHWRSQPVPVTRGVSFLGYRIFPCMIRLKRTNLINAIRRQNLNDKLLKSIVISIKDYNQHSAAATNAIMPSGLSLPPLVAAAL